MIIHIDGTAQELLEFVNGMQFTAMPEFCGTAKKAEEAKHEATKKADDKAAKFAYEGGQIVLVHLNKRQADLLMLEASLRKMSVEDVIKHFVGKCVGC